MRRGATQGQGGDATGGVEMASLYFPGSGSAVFLVHAGSPRQAPADHHPSDGNQWLGHPDEQEMNPAGVYQLRNGCYHTGSVNVL
jgi:hypothetical protein